MKVGNNKKVALVMLLTSLVIMILLFIPRGTDKNTTISSELNKTTKDSKALDKKKEDTYTELKPSDDVVINKIIGDFTKNINKKNFSNAYLMLDREYIKDFDVQLDFFSERYNFKQEKKFKINNIDSSISDRYIVDIKFQDVDAEVTEKIVRKVFTIYKDGNRKNAIAEIGILNENILEVKNEFRPSITFSLEKIYTTSEGSVAIVNAENKTKSYFAIKNDRFGFYAKDGQYTYDHQMLNNYSEDYMITPGINKKFIINFSKVQYPKSIGIYYMGIDNTNENKENEEKVDIFEIK